MEQKYLHFLALCILCYMSYSTSEPMCPCGFFYEPDPRCVIEEAIDTENGTEIERMTCYPVGIDEKTLEEIIHETPVFSSADAVTATPGFTFSERAKSKGQAIALAPFVKELILHLAGNNLKICESCLQHFPNLERLFIIGGRHRRPGAVARWYRIAIAPGAFRYTKKINNIRLVDHLDLPQSTIDSFNDVHDKITSLTMWDIKPADSVTALTKKLTKVKNLDIIQKNVPTRCPDDLLHGSAQSLRRLHLQGCSNTHLPASMFRGMQKLKTLRIADGGFTDVEPGAFDDLINLEGLSIAANKIKRLPKNAFQKLKNLQTAEITGGRIENLSERNFTHSHNFQEFSSSQRCCPCRE